jgi:hypothetical protein
MMGRTSIKPPTRTDAVREAITITSSRFLASRTRVGAGTVQGFLVRLRQLGRSRPSGCLLELK